MSYYNCCRKVLQNIITSRSDASVLYVVNYKVEIPESHIYRDVVSFWCRNNETHSGFYEPNPVIFSVYVNVRVSLVLFTCSLRELSVDPGTHPWRSPCHDGTRIARCRSKSVLSSTSRACPAARLGRTTDLSRDLRQSYFSCHL